MSAVGVHKVTEMFEQELCRYTGAPYAVAVDNASNGLLLCLEHEKVQGVLIVIPRNTYPSVACEIIHAGGKVVFRASLEPCGLLTGQYQLNPTRVWDSALRFTHNMYIPGALMVLSFSGPHKHLKLGKGGAILCDERDTRDWLKRARFSGRSECSYHVDNFTQIGHNCYMLPEIAARGLMLMSQFYNLDGSARLMPDITLPYPDLSKFPVYNQ
jgi:dTDP-4-amino-4,6-dideoxygalactose transaminase